MSLSDELRSLALSLPGAWEDDPFGHAEPLVKVGPKIFCFLDASRLTVKVDPERGALLRDAGLAGFAPYLSKRHWVLVPLPGRLEVPELEELLERSYELVVAGLPRRLRPAALDVPPAPASEQD